MNRIPKEIEDIGVEKKKIRMGKDNSTTCIRTDMVHVETILRRGGRREEKKRGGGNVGQGRGGTKVHIYMHLNPRKKKAANY